MHISKEKTYLKRKELISMYNALDIAKYIVIKCMNDGHPITNLYLQKILFYIQREYLFSTDEPLFGDSFEAWKFGPVVPKVYYRYCGFGGNEINFLIDMTVPKIDRKDKKIINRITEAKRDLMPWDLVKETHQKGGAWDRVFNDGKGNRNLITKEYIRKYG